MLCAVMFAHFVFALLIFVRAFCLQNPKTENPGKLLLNAPRIYMLGVTITLYYCIFVDDLSMSEDTQINSLQKKLINMVI